MAADMTDAVAEAQRIHGTSNVCTAALGRLLVAAAFTGQLLKEPEASATLRVNGGGPAGTLIALCLLFFALSSVIGWALIGEMCWGWLFGGRRGAVLGFRLLFALLCPLGALSGGEIAWQLADTLNGLMAIPNLIALLLLSGRAAEIAKGGA